MVIAPFLLGTKPLLNARGYGEVRQTLQEDKFSRVTRHLEGLKAYPTIAETYDEAIPVSRCS
jgi:hypothetical protein